MTLTRGEAVLLDHMATGDAAMTMQIGEVAARTVMTVRSLHYYEQIGLLTPAGRSAAGYRLYGHEQIERR